MVRQEKLQALIDYYKRALETHEKELDEAYDMNSTGEVNRTERYAKIRELQATLFEIKHIIVNLESLED